MKKSVLGVATFFIFSFSLVSTFASEDLVYSIEFKELIENEWVGTGITEKDITSAKTDINNYNQPGVLISLTDNGQKKFSVLSTQVAKKKEPFCNYQGGQISVFVYGENISEPCLTEKILSNEILLTIGGTAHDDSIKQAQSIVDQINTATGYTSNSPSLFIDDRLQTQEQSLEGAANKGFEFFSIRGLLLLVLSVVL